MQPSADHESRRKLLAELLDQHASALALYAAQWTTAADDCVQEALVELAGIDPLPERPLAWLYVAVKRRALNQLRGETRRASRERLAWQQRLAGAMPDGERRELLDAVASLPDELREIVVLKIWGNLTFGEMAEVLDQSSSSLHREYRKAIERLRKQWEVPCPNTTKSE